MDYETELNQRYAPYADWSARLDLSELDSVDSEIWWRSPERIREQREDASRPLSGLHLAIDPGHIGGAWAEVEGRHFQIHVDDFPVREGELVLEVAKMVEAAVTEMGGRVTLLRKANRPLNPRAPEAYFEEAAARVPLPEVFSWSALLDYGERLRPVMRRMSVVTGELIERARLVNEVVRPDALISLHINAAPWPVGKDGAIKYELVSSNHSHVLIFGCLSDAELSRPRQEQELRRKLSNGSGVIERQLGHALGVSLGAFTQLPPSSYSGRNAVRLTGTTPYLWARNLLLLRSVHCPVVLLEPYIANSRGSYRRIQEALGQRQAGGPLAEDDILLEYANAVIQALLAVYGPDVD
ncbi:MAG: hypothetical protein ACNA77_05005 [Opitutales bacterium]